MGPVTRFEARSWTLLLSPFTPATQNLGSAPTPDPVDSRRSVRLDSTLRLITAANPLFLPPPPKFGQIANVRASNLKGTGASQAGKRPDTVLRPITSHAGTTMCHIQDVYIYTAFRLIWEYPTCWPNAMKPDSSSIHDETGLSCGMRQRSTWPLTDSWAKTDARVPPIDRRERLERHLASSNPYFEVRRPE